MSIVMKFGGASVKDAAGIRNVAQIIAAHRSQPCVVVVSAMDKTTNELERLAALAQIGDEAGALAQFERISNFHKKIISDLFEGEISPAVAEQLAGFLTEIQRIVQGILLLGEFSAHTYDRIVAYGELLSSVVLAGYAEAQLGGVTWLDARRIIRTDAAHKQANVIWSLTEENIETEVLPHIAAGKTLIVQGFIGSTPDGITTTLGREGSDYTAAIFANCLGAESLTVWKDVPGVLNADPRTMVGTVKIDQLSYQEAVEMTFYGATVIHPKTIKPLYAKLIPLRVRSFKDMTLPGTVVGAAADSKQTTAYIAKKNQVFLKIQPKDFSFMEESIMSEVFRFVYKSGVKINLVQNSAISLLLCVDNTPDELAAFASLLMDAFSVEKADGLTLHTILNFTPQDIRRAADAVMVQQHGRQLSIVS